MRKLSVVLLAVFPLAAQVALPPPANIKVDFIRDIEPILSAKCYSCHGDKVRQAGLRLDRRQAAMRGGDYGPVIIAGKSADSKLIRRLVGGDGGLQMPPTGALPTEEVALLRAWVDQGADFRLEIKDEAPPKPVDPRIQSLIQSVRTSDLKTVSKALEADPSIVNAKDNAGSTLLQHAAGFGSIAMMQLLLDKGANVNATNRLNSTPLHWAIGDESKVRLLLAAGANVNARTNDGRTPLFQAATLGNGSATFHLLLDKGADPTIPTANGLTVLIAASRQHNGILKTLLARKLDVNRRAGNGFTALMTAAAAGNTEGVRLLLEAGADPNILSKQKDSALGEAATSGAEESVRMLLAKGAAVNVPDARGYTPLMYAAASDAIPASTVKLLIAAGADVHPKAEGETAASLAAKRGDTAVARLLGASTAAIQPQPRKTPFSVPVAVSKATHLLEAQSANFIRIGGCNSCHGQDLASASTALARVRGFDAPAVIPQLSETMRGVDPERLMDLNAIGANSVAWELFDFGMNRVPRSEYTDAAARFVRISQTAAGNWQVAESRRPPMNSGFFQTAALGVYSLKHYGEDGDKPAIAKAAAWMATAKPVYTQDLAFQILGLTWANGQAKAVDKAIQALLRLQREDGGWNQLPAMASDAYATGQALYALAASGRLAVTDPAYKKGIRYLLETQAQDGSWHVATRSIWFQPYFESGFPYAHDQWISVAGTAWASMALAMTQEPRQISRNGQP